MQSNEILLAKVITTIEDNRLRRKHMTRSRESCQMVSFNLRRSSSAEGETALFHRRSS